MSQHLRNSFLVMKTKSCFLLLLALSALTAFTFAQEGHPLVGTWSGDWGPTPTHRNQVTIVMNWDGKNINGIINPGPDVIPMKVALDPNGLRNIECPRSSTSVRFIIDGKLTTSFHKRTLTGLESRQRQGDQPPATTSSFTNSWTENIQRWSQYDRELPRS
jgi:hypothetical protein